MNDLRTKLAALFRRCTSPDISDDEAAVALREFRSLGVTRREIDEALGISDKPAPVAKQPPTQAVRSGPTMPFGKHKGMALADLAADEPGYLRWLLDNTELREPLLSQVEEALGD